MLGGCEWSLPLLLRSHWPSLGPLTSALEGLPSFFFDLTMATDSYLRVPVSHLPVVLIFTFLKRLDPFSSEIWGRSTVHKINKTRVYSVQVGGGGGGDGGVKGLDRWFSIFVSHQNYPEGFLKQIWGPRLRFFNSVSLLGAKWLASKEYQEMRILLVQGAHFENHWLSLPLSAWLSPTKAVPKQLGSSSSRFQGFICGTQLETIHLQVKSTFLCLDSRPFHSGPSFSLKPSQSNCRLPSNSWPVLPTAVQA